MNALDERKLDEYLELIDKKAEAHRSNRWNYLTDAERTTVVAYALALEVSNGGFEQFFANSSGDRWHETLCAINTVGASKLATLFEKALTVFPNNRPSEDQAMRCNQLTTAGESASALLWQLTREYYDLQAQSAEHCLYQRLTAFAIQQLGK